MSTDTDNHYSLRSGSSEAAAFVSAAASLLIRTDLELEPYQIKQRLISTSDFKIIGQEKRPIMGGILNLHRALSPIREDLVVFKNKSKPEKTGKVIPNRGHVNFRVLNLIDKDTNKSLPTCPFVDLLRIDHSGEENNVIVVCRDTFRHDKFSDSPTGYLNEAIKVIRGGKLYSKTNDPTAYSPMKCLRKEATNPRKALKEKETCFSIRKMDGTVKPFLLKNVQNIYFGITD